MKTTNKTTKTDYKMWPKFESLQALAGDLEIPIARLKLARKAGCPVQLGGRCDTREMLRWFLTEKPGDDSIDWDTRLKKALAERAEHRLKKEQDLICDRPLVARGAAQIMSLVFSTLD